MRKDIDVIGPPDDPDRYLRQLDTPETLPADPTEREILRLRLLHPDLHLYFRVDDLTGLDAETKKAILASLREVLGILPLRNTTT